MPRVTLKLLLACKRPVSDVRVLVIILGHATVCSIGFSLCFVHKIALQVYNLNLDQVISSYYPFQFSHTNFGAYKIVGVNLSIRGCESINSLYLLIEKHEI